MRKARTTIPSALVRWYQDLAGAYAGALAAKRPLLLLGASCACFVLPAVAQPVDLGFSLDEEKHLPQTPLRSLREFPAPPQVDAARAPPAPGTCELPGLNQVLTLADAVMHALCRNPQTRQAWATALAQAAEVGIARSAYLPTLSASLGRTRDEPGNATGVTVDTKNASLNYVLWDFGLRSANLEAAQQSLAAALASQDATLQTVFATAAAAYYDAATGQAALQAAQLAQRAAEESMNAALAKQRQGAGTPTDALQARSAYSKAVLERVKAEGAALAARGALAFAMGLDAQTPLQLPGDLLNDASALPGTEFLQAVEDLISQVKLSHPAVLAAQAQFKAAQARVSSTQAEGRPSIALNAARYLNGRPSNSLLNAASTETTYGVVITIPLFEGFGRAAKVNAARARAEGKAIELAGAELQVSLDVWKAYQDLQSQTAALEASRDLLDSATMAAKATARGNNHRRASRRSFWRKERRECRNIDVADTNFAI